MKSIVTLRSYNISSIVRINQTLVSPSLEVLGHNRIQDMYFMRFRHNVTDDKVISTY